MKNKPIVAPSILAADLSRLGDEIEDVIAKGADWLHIDVMDGSFVPPITFGGNIVAAARKSSSIFLDVHLMVVEPERHFDAFQQAGCNQLIIHRETCPHLYRSLSELQQRGLGAGVAVNPGTPIEEIFDVLDVCDLVLIMTVNPGWGGQRFIASCVGKIERLRAEIDQRQLSTKIEVDGGINGETASLCSRAGAEVFVAGTYIFGAHDRAKAIASLRTA